MTNALPGVLLMLCCLLQSAYGLANLSPQVRDPANFLTPRIRVGAEMTTTIKPSRAQTLDRQATASAIPEWLSREPLGESESINLYVYCHNDPINKIDVLGLKEVANGGYTNDYFEWANSVQLSGGERFANGLLGIAAMAKVWDKDDSILRHLAIQMGRGFANGKEELKTQGPVGQVVGRTAIFMVETNPLHFPYALASIDGETPKNVANSLMFLNAYHEGEQFFEQPSTHNALNTLEAAGSAALFWKSFSIRSGHQSMAYESSVNTSQLPAGRGYMVSFMGKNGIRRYDHTAATLGAQEGTVWMSPLEDIASITNRAGVVTGTGHAPGLLTSYLKGEDIFGIVVPREGLSLRLPGATDVGANRHFRLGGFTGVEHNGVWRSSGVRELIAPGGNPVPPGSVFFKLNADGSWMPIRRY